VPADAQGSRPPNTPDSLRIWVDAQLPPALARWLRTDFFADATHVEALGLVRSKDPTIFATAREAGNVVVVTKDEDFLRLLSQHGPPPRVVWVRCGNVTNRELRRILIETWPRLATLLASGETLVELRRAPDTAR
jgi:predicted nuclease of predicted toxin-antitoxin system